MSPPGRRIGWPVLVGLLLACATLLLAFLLAQLKYQKRAAQPLPVYGQVAEFTLTNQDGAAVSLANLRGHVWVADIIFTRCAGPCLRMSRQMMELQKALPATSQVKLVTLTTDPEFDTPEVLKKYSARFDADLQRWMLLTGTKKQIAAVAVDSLKFTAIEKKPEERETPQDLFVHSTIFVLVDKLGQLRGVFDTGGEGVDLSAVKGQILYAAKRLEREK